MIREYYVFFWGIFFIVAAIVGTGIIVCLALIAKYLKMLVKKKEAENGNRAT